VSEPLPSVHTAPTGAPRAPRTHWPRRVALLIVLGLGLSLLTTLLALGEAVPRLVELPERLAKQRTAETGLYVLDEAAGYVMRPHYNGRWSSLEFDQPFRTNAHGLRGPELGPKAPDEFRIVVLGDSIVFGGQVAEEERFTEQLEGLLHTRGCARVRVVNVGTPGWTTFNEAGFLQANRGWLEPDLVVVAVFLGNDVEENVMATISGYEQVDVGNGVRWAAGARGEAGLHRLDTTQRPGGSGRIPAAAGIGEARRGREEVGARDVGADGERCGMGAAAAGDPEDDQEQAKRGHHFTEPEAATLTQVGRDAHRGQGKHDVGDDDAQGGTRQLSGDVGRPARPGAGRGRRHRRS